MEQTWSKFSKYTQKVQIQEQVKHSAPIQNIEVVHINIDDDNNVLALIQFPEPSEEELQLHNHKRCATYITFIASRDMDKARSQMMQPWQNVKQFGICVQGLLMPVKSIHTIHWKIPYFSMSNMIELIL